MSAPPRRRLRVLRAHVAASSSGGAASSSGGADVERLAWEETATSYSTGMFRPVEEEAHALPCSVIVAGGGDLPPDLIGTYFRNGPNAHFPATPGRDPFHYFDGDGMIASFTLDGRGCVFSHKWVHTARFHSDAREGRSLYDFGALSVGKPVGHRVLDDDGNRMGKANTSLLLHHRCFYALEDADLPYRISLPSLQTMGRVRFEVEGVAAGKKEAEQDDSAEQRVFTAHPKVCPSTGELVGYGCEYTPMDQQWIYRLLSKSGMLTRQFAIPLRHTSYNHDCAATRNFSIVYDGNLVLSWDKVMGGSGGRDNGIWRFRRDIPGRIGIFPRHATESTQVQWFEVEPYCVSHTACAWEETDAGDGNPVVIIVTNNTH